MNVNAHHRGLLAILILSHALLAGAYSVWNPLAEAPDEADHFAYVRYLAAERSLPSAPRLTQSKHPPLYHIAATFAASAGDPLDYQFLRANPDVSLKPVRNWSPNFFIHTTLEDWPWRDGPLAFHMARLLSVLLSTLAILATYGMVRSGFPSWPGLALASAGVLAFIPEFAFIGGAVNNDSGTAFMGALILWGAMSLYHHGGKWHTVWWAPMVMGAGLLVKVSTVALWPVVFVAIVAGAGRAASIACNDPLSWIRSVVKSWRRWVVSCLAVLGIAVLIASPWLIRNWRLYGDPLGYSMARQTIDLRPAPWTIADSVWLLKGWFLSFWGKFGAAGHIPMPLWIYWILAMICVIGATGLIRAWRRFPTDFRPAILLLTLSVMLVALGIWRYSLVALGTDQGRLLYPAISAIVTLLVLGLAAWTAPRWRPVVATAAIVALATLSIYGLVGVIQPAFARPRALTVTETGLGSESGPVQFGELMLVDWQTSPEPQLLWYAPQKPTDDWRTALRVVAEDGSLVWEWRRSPGYGRWSTDHWPAGTTLRDEYEVDWPDWAGPGRYRIELSVQPLYGDPVMPIVAGQPATAQDQPTYFLGWLDRK